MAGLTREQIMAADDLPREKVTIPEWGGDVTIRTMTAFEKDAFELASLKNPGADAEVNYSNFRLRLLQLVIVDDKGNRLFGDEPADLEALGSKSSQAIDLLWPVAARLNGLDDADTEKNSEIPESSSSTD